MHTNQRDKTWLDPFWLESLSAFIIPNRLRIPLNAQLLDVIGHLAEIPSKRAINLKTLSPVQAREAY